MDPLPLNDDELLRAATSQPLKPGLDLNPILISVALCVAFALMLYIVIATLKTKKAA